MEPLDHYPRQASQREANRVAALDAGRDLFYERGYSGTSLAMIAERAGVSTATLFKRFPTKASVLEGVIDREWSIGRPGPDAGAGDARKSEISAALLSTGTEFAAFLRRPGTAALFRLIIAEMPSVPELVALRPRLVDGPYYTVVRDLLRTATPAGPKDVFTTAARRFVGLIAGQILWPALMDPAFGDDDGSDDDIVRSAVALTLEAIGHGTAPWSPS